MWTPLAPPGAPGRAPDDDEEGTDLAAVAAGRLADAGLEEAVAAELGLTEMMLAGTLMWVQRTAAYAAGLSVGEPVDKLGKVPHAKRYPIHRPAPTFEEHARSELVLGRFEALGLSDVSSDAIGNVYARRPGRSPRCRR